MTMLMSSTSTLSSGIPCHSNPLEAGHKPQSLQYKLTPKKNTKKNKSTAGSIIPCNIPSNCTMPSNASCRCAMLLCGVEVRVKITNSKNNRPNAPKGKCVQSCRNDFRDFFPFKASRIFNFRNSFSSFSLVPTVLHRWSWSCENFFNLSILSISCNISIF